MRHALLACIALLLSAAPVDAEELRLGWRFDTEYDNRVVGVEGGDDDVIFEFGPTLELSGERPRFRYSVDHSSRFQKYGKLERLNGWVHEVGAAGSWDFHPRANLSVSNRFSSYPRLGIVEALPEDPVAAAQESQLSLVGSNPLRSNSFTSTLTWVPRPRLTTLLQVSNFFRDFDAPDLDNQNVLSTTLITQWLYQLNASHQLGQGFRLRVRNFASSGDGQSEGGSNIYELFASWNWQIDERTTFSSRVGPSFSRDEVEVTRVGRYGQVPGRPGLLVDPATCEINAFPDLAVPEAFKRVDESCDPLDQRELTEAERDAIESAPLAADLTPGMDGRIRDPGEDSNVNVFFSLALQRSWDRLQLFADWTRTDSELRGVGSATLLDSFRTGLRWYPRPQWSSVLTFVFTRRFTDLDREFVFPVVLNATSPLSADAGQPGIAAIDGVAGALVVDTQLATQRAELTSDALSLQLRLNREWGRNLGLFAGLTLLRRENEIETPFDTVSTREDRFEVHVGFNYRFRPIRF